MWASCSTLAGMVKEREAKKHEMAAIQMDIFKKRLAAHMIINFVDPGIQDTSKSPHVMRSSHTN